jgi:hypothetical protein
MSATINFDELTAEQKKLLGIPTPRKGTFSAEQMRSWALKVLAQAAGLSRAERDRVLRHALKVN